jgi:hypothetical protein
MRAAAGPRGTAIVAVIAVVGALAAGPADAKTASQPSLVVWSGHLGAETTMHGVVLKPNGQGTIVAVSVANRDRATPTTVGPFRPNASALAQIRAAAKAALTAPRVTLGPAGPSAAYASATIQRGAAKRVLVAVTTAPPQLATLITALNRALPATAQLVQPPGPLGAVGLTPRSDPFAGVLIQHSQGTAPCVPGDAATSVAQPISLKDAAGDGLVTLTAKGGFGTDDVAVDAHWAPLADKSPVVLRMNFEITPPDGLSPTDQARVVNGIKSSVESRLGGLKASDGTPLTVQLNVRQRDPGQPPSSCFHEITVNQDVNPDVTSAINTKLNMTGPFQPDPLPGYGNWSTLGTSWQTGGGFSDRAANIWTHEALHFAGLDEAYHPAFQVDDVIKNFPQDARFQNKDDVLAWAAQEEAFAGLDVNSGRFRLPSDPGHEHDYMGRCPDTPPCHVDQAAVDQLVAAGRDNLEITGSPGDLLLNKDPTEQSLGVGTTFRLLVHRGTPAHVDGLVAYCIDADRHIPEAGGLFDVLGRAGDQGDPGMSALQAVLDEIAREQTAPLATVEGGQFAVWRVTDNETAGDDIGPIRSILDAAHIDVSATFATPHYNDPNAAGAQTGSVSSTAVLPTATLVVPPGPAPAPAPARLEALHVQQLAAGRRLLSVQITDTASEAATLTLQRGTRRHGHTSYRRIRRYQAVALHAGLNILSLATPKLTPGAYRVVAAAASATRTASLTIRR